MLEQKCKASLFIISLGNNYPTNYPLDTPIQDIIKRIFLGK